MKRTSVWIVIAAWAIASSACGPDRPEGLYEPQDGEEMGAAPDLGDRPDMGPAPDMTQEAEGLSGTWLLVHSQSTCVLNQEQMATTDYLVTITQRGSTLFESRKICGINLTPVLGTSVQVPAATRESVVFVPIDRGYVTSVKEGGGYSSSTELNLWGVTLEEPETDALPRDPMDATVVDLDGDGNPAVTFSIADGECERYMGQRQIIRYQGTLTSPTQIDGTSVGLTEAVVYGATRSFCRIAPPIIPNDRHSVFRMVRVDGLSGGLMGDTDGDGEVSCAEASALAPMVLERRDADASRCR